MRYALERFWFAAVVGLTGVLGMLTNASDAFAVPSMGRQTGYSCARCHTVFPELTPFGRAYKLGGYAASSAKWDERPWQERIPVAAGLISSRTSTSDTSAGGTTPDMFPENNKLIAQTVALYYGGKITDNSGGFIQYNYDGVGKQWGMEMFDVRYANSLDLASKELVWGVTLNNTPTVSDVWNSTPVWGLPHVNTAAPQMPAATLIDMTLAQRVGGITAYGMWDDMFYAEIGDYRTAKSGAFRFVSWGQKWNDPALFGSVIQNDAPYWRLALQNRSGPHIFEVGTFGMSAKLWLDDTDHTLGANKFLDTAADARYEYLEGNHCGSVSTTYIHEKKNWSSPAQLAGMTSNPSDTLNTLRVDLHYFYQRKFGGGLQFFNTTGSTNALAYNTGDPLMGSASGSPNSRGWISALDYLPWQNVKLELRYQAFDKFNGASSNYNGAGRNASTNNITYLMGWFLF